MEVARGFIVASLAVALAYLVLQLRDAAVEVFLVVHLSLKSFKVVWHGLEAAKEPPRLRDGRIDLWGLGLVITTDTPQSVTSSLTFFIRASRRLVKVALRIDSWAIHWRSTFLGAMAKHPTVPSLVRTY
jgi:hypothetical protein